MRYEFRLKELRAERGMTQRELAAAVNVTPGAVAQWEKGTSNITTENLVALTKALNCTLDELVRTEATANAPA